MWKWLVQVSPALAYHEVSASSIAPPLEMAPAMSTVVGSEPATASVLEQWWRVHDQVIHVHSWFTNRPRQCSRSTCIWILKHNAVLRLPRTVRKRRLSFQLLRLHRTIYCIDVACRNMMCYHHALVKQNKSRKILFGSMRTTWCYVDSTSARRVTLLHEYMFIVLKCLRSHG